MSGSGTLSDPYTSFSSEQAAEHWENGGGNTVYVDMASHMANGGGSVFSINDFADPIGQAVQGLIPGTVVRFESNKAARIETGALQATAVHSYYGTHGLMSDEAFVWGSTSAGFRGTVTVQENGTITIDGQIRSFQEQFDYSANSWNPFLELARLAGKVLAGPGSSYNISFVGENGSIVSGTYELQEFGSFGTYSLRSAGDQCFVSKTEIDMWPKKALGQLDGDSNYDEIDVLSNIWKKPIEMIEVGDIVVSFDGNGRLVPGRVSELYQNTTSSLITLSFSDGREPLIVTPGHPFLDEVGNFTNIGDLLQLSGNNAKVVDITGTICKVQGSCVVYDAESASLFETVSAPMKVGGGC